MPNCAAVSSTTMRALAVPGCRNATGPTVRRASMACGSDDVFPLTPQPPLPLPRRERGLGGEGDSEFQRGCAMHLNSIYELTQSRDFRQALEARPPRLVHASLLLLAALL